MLDNSKYLPLKQKSDLTSIKIIENVLQNQNLQGCIFYGSLLGTLRHKGFIPWDDDVDYVIPFKNRYKFQKLLKLELLKKSNLNFELQNTSGTLTNLFEPDYLVNKNFIRYSTNYIKKLNPISFNAKIDIFYYVYLNEAEILEFKKLFKIYTLISSSIRVKTNSLFKKTLFWFLLFVMYKKLLKDAKKFENKICKNWKDNVRKPFSIDRSRDGKNLILHSLCDFSDFTLLEFEDTMVTAPLESEKFLEMYFGNWKQFPPKDKQVPVHDVTNICASEIKLTNLKENTLEIEQIFATDLFTVILFKNQGKVELNLDSSLYEIYEYQGSKMKIICSNKSKNFVIKSKFKNNYKYHYKFRDQDIKISSTNEQIKLKFKKFITNIK